jgi:TetR/AcrR family transcriptional regulator, cholesterol catabolism regulator
MSKRLPVLSGDTRDKIIKGAAFLYCEYGYAYGSIRNIAAAIGIQGPSVYHHFASKEDMTIAMLEQGGRLAMRELSTVDLAANADDPAELLRQAVAAHVRAYRHPDRTLMALVRIYRQLPPELFAVARRELKPYLQRWKEIIAIVAGEAEAKRSGEQISLLIFGALNALTDWEAHPGLARPLPELSDLLVKMVMVGVGVKGKSKR